MPNLKKPLQVIFQRRSTGEVFGNILADPRPTLDGDRTKIVLIYGFNRNDQAAWKKALPKDGETWSCEEVRDTKPADPHSGAILVNLLENFALKNAQAEAQRRLELAPVYHVLQELEKQSRSPLTDQRRDDVARALCSLAEDAAVRLGFSEATKVFLRASGSGLAQVREFAGEKSGELARHSAWRVIADLDLDESGQRSCFEAVIGWLAKLREAGGVPRRRFVLSYDRFFQCPGCSAKVKLKPEEWERYTVGEDVAMECPVCNTSGVTVK